MYKFKEGDKVRVVKKCVSYSNCHYGNQWENNWGDDMDVYIYSKEIGIVYQVTDLGIKVDFEDDFWYFPSDALELVEDNVQKSLADEKDIGVGDIIECIDDGGVHYLSIGKQYMVIEADSYGNIAIIDNDEDQLYVNKEWFKLVNKAAPKEQQPIEELAIIPEDTIEPLIAECSVYFDEVSIYIDKPEEKIEYTLQIDGYKFVGTKEYVVSKMKGAIEWMKP